MANLRVQRRRGKGSDDGASLVEFALIMPLLFLLLLGTLTGGLTLSRHNSIKNAAREGTRFAAVLPISPTTVDSYLQSVIEQSREAATGDLAGGVPDQRICASVVYRTTANPTPTATRHRVEESGLLKAAEAGSCFADGRPTNELRVQVEVRRTSEISAILFERTVSLLGRSVTRYER